MKITNELKESEEKFKLLFQKSLDPILIIDGYNFVECNEAAVNILGYNSEKEICNMHPSKLSPEYQPDGQKSLEKSIEMMDLAYKNGYNRFEWMHLGTKGENIIVDVALTKIPYKGKDMIFTIWRDISQRKKYEEEIIKSKKKLSILFEQAADGILVGVKGGEIVEANESMQKLTGYQKEELIGSNITKLFQAEELYKKPLQYDQVNKGETVINERNIIQKNGNIVAVEMNTRALSDGRMQALFRDISLRKKAEKEAETSQNLLQKAEIVAGLGRYYFDIKLNKWESTDILNKIYGISKSYKRNFEGWINIIHPDFQKKINEYFIKTILTNHEPFDKIYKIVRKNDKKERWVHGYGELEFDSNHNPIKLFGTIQDITEEQEAEIALRESEEKYRRIFLNSPLGIIQYDSNGIITDCNNHLIRIVGSSREALIGFNMIKDIRDENLKRAVKKSLTKGESYYEDWYVSITANKKTFVRILFKSIQAEKNKNIYGIGLVEDITERKIAEQNQKISEEKFKSIATLLPEVVFETDIQGNITFVNLKAFEIFEYEPDDIHRGLNVFQMLAPEEIVRAKRDLSQINENFKAIGEKYMAITKSGKKFPVLIYTDTIKHNNKVTGLRGIIVKIEELHNAQENLKKSEEKFRLLFENSNDAIILMENEIFIDCNEKTLEMFQCTREQIVGVAPYKYSPNYQPDGRKSKEKTREIVDNALKGIPQIFEWIHKKHDGTEFYAEVSLNKLEFKNTVAIQAIVRDITERKEIEQQIFNAVTEAEEKERQRLASDIHDEIGPLLSSLKMYIESMNQNNDIQKQIYLKGQLQSLIKQSIENVREVSNALSPYLLRKYGLKIAVKSFFENSKEMVKISFNTNLIDERFPINVETVYFRILKELFNNTIKHAKAEKVNIMLNYKNEKLTLTYEDDGIGIKKEDFKKLEKNGIGLLNITNRILSIQGKYNYFTDQEKGYKFQITKEIKPIK